MTGRSLTRFRADPSKVRIVLRPEGTAWRIRIESHCGEYPRLHCLAAHAELIPGNMMNLLVQARDEQVPGIDLFMEWAYEHPHGTNQYHDFKRIEDDNELMKKLGLFNHVNETHG